MQVLKDFLKVTGFLIRASANIRYPRALVAVAVVAGVVSGVSNTGLLAVINSRLSGGGSTRNAVLAFAALCLVLPLSRLVSHVLLISFTERAMLDLRLHLCRQLLVTRLRRLEELGPHRLLGALTSDVPTIASALTVLPHLCMHMAIVVCCFAYLGWLSWGLLIGVLAFLTFAIVSYQLPLTRAFRYLRRGRDDWDVLLKHFRAVTEGAKELKLHRERRREFLDGKLRATARGVEKNNVIGNAIFVAASSWGHIMFFVLIGLILFVLPSVRPVALETLTGYTLTLLYVMVPLETLINRLPDIGRASVAVAKIEQLGLDEAEADEEYLGADAPPAWERLSLAGVKHTYHLERENRSFTLGPIDLDFRPGELVFLTGGNGSGKTTLAKLLMGLYVPEEGEVLLDGRPVTDQTRDEFRQNFSAVFSDFFLFDSLLGMGGDAADARAREHLAELQLEHKVTIEGGVLSTTELSQGQRKRLALLTAYMEDRPVYLFDEWAADQDPQFKELFYYQLLPDLKARGKLVIAISHDDRYYHLADRVIKLDYGRVEYDRCQLLTAELLGAAAAIEEGEPLPSGA
ncbi:MAG TPA: cyclic peptide export ABC transporter [Pyrinomonadaceae bacterium]|jgi:putative ATP-binding cassette transporter|nr:cyclic peptide export ABC transporter [Pyrinomonadaceae bacterium]